MKNFINPSIIKGFILSIFVILILIVSSCKKDVPIAPKVESFKVSATIANTNSNLDLKGFATGTINLKNDSSSIIRADLVAKISNSNLIDSFFIDGTKIDLSNGRFTFSKTLPASSTTAINFKYVLKANFTPEQSENGIVSTLTIDTISYNGFSQRVPVSADLFILSLKATAFIDLITSVNKSLTAIDTFVVGKSVAEAFQLKVTRAGIAEVEVIGLKSDNTIPISHYWITNSVDEDFGVRVSNFNSNNNNIIKTKTPISSKTFSINLVAGINNIVLKTTNLYRAVPVGTRVGFKITLANAITFTSTYRVESEHVDLTDKIVVKNIWTGGYNLSALTERLSSNISDFFIYPQNSNGSFINNFPAVMSMGISTEYYARNYPLLDFSNRGNEKFYTKAYTPNEIKINILENFIYDKKNNCIKIYGNAFQMTLLNPGNQYITLPFYLNIYNGDSVNFPRPPTSSATLFPAKKGWKFYGNPEMEIMVDNELSQIVRLY